MRGPYKYEIMSAYPHLSEGEAKIWTRFVLHNPGMFDEVFYDVNVGSFRGNENNLLPEWQKDRQYLGTYKIDVLGFKNKIPYIIEIKRHATTKALGEVFMYWHLYKRDFQPVNEPITMIITDELMPDMQEICDLDNTLISIV